MAVIDYAQVRSCAWPASKKKWVEHVYVWGPERKKDIDKYSVKCIDAAYLNTQRKFTDGSKAVVGRRLSTGRMVVIKVMEAM